MRNLRQYPITKQEILECLSTLAQDMLKEKRVGDMRPSLLQEASKIVEEAKYEPNFGEAGR